MPAIPSNSQVLVTGANGFVAVWIVKVLLERGYRVIGTIRSESKGNHLKQIFSSYGDQLKLAVVGEITAEGAFDEVVKDVDAVIHTASPFRFESDDPEDYLRPAVEGTLSILKSILKNGRKVQRVVVTSSVAAIEEVLPAPKVFTEKDWNRQSVAIVEEKGKAASNVAKYYASKTRGEQVAWDFVKEHQSEISWDITTLQPPYVFGPVIHEVNDLSQLSTSPKMLLDATLPSSTLSPEELALPRGGWVDVRDVALAHVLSIEQEAAGGQRIIVASGSWTYQDWLDAANGLSPQPLKRELAKGVPGSGNHVKHLIRFDNSKAQKVLGLKFRPLEETIKGVLEDYAERGW